MAIALFPGGEPPRDWDTRAKMIDSLDEDAREKLGEIDSEFYEYRDPLEELQVKFMVANKGQIDL